MLNDEEADARLLCQTMLHHTGAQDRELWPPIRAGAACTGSSLDQELETSLLSLLHNTLYCHDAGNMILTHAFSTIL